MKWFERRKALKIATLFLLAIAGWVVWLMFQPDGLAAYKAELAARGEELSLLRLDPGYSEVAAGHHRQFSDVAAQLNPGPVPPGAISLMARTNHQQARVAWRQADPALPSQGTWEDFAVQLDENEPTLAELRSLITNVPAGTAHDFNQLFGQSPINLVSRRKVAQSLAAAVVGELHRQRLAAAATNLHALILMGGFRDEGSLLVDYMVQVATASLAISATWEALQAPRWTDSQLRTTQSLWQDIDHARHFIRTLEMERAFTVACYDNYRTNATERGQMAGLTGGGGGRPMSETLYESFYLPFWAKTWSKGDERRFLEAMQPAVEGIRRAANEGAYHRFPPVLAEALQRIRADQSILDRLRYPIASLVIPNWEKAAVSMLRFETQRQMALTALALKRWQLKHGSLPTTLDALKPDLLSSNSIDQFNGQPLIYQRLSDSRFVLRSFGVNGQDDKGEPDDVIWPEPELAPGAHDSFQSGPRP